MYFLRHLLVSLQLSIVQTLLPGSNLHMDRSLIGQGFHRDLNTYIVLDKDLRGLYTSPECSLLLIETLPAGVYADPFQLSSMVPFGGPKIRLDGAVNIEAAEFMSKSHELYIFVNVNLYAVDTMTEQTVINISFPIHARYHKPSSDPNVSHSTVTIFHPSLYSNCSKSDAGSFLSAPCDVSSNLLCRWEQLSYICSAAPLELMIPVGMARDKPIVILVTLLVTATICSLLIKFIWESDSQTCKKHS
ncbi:unnamed protein product [Lymnaea stagnalis]|uniref:Phosphatidylinositol-glycan biosynthesis class X protein n=1 Tax=Lymnaea stagnalis TaxID=6523 RepID=A0AAV2H9B7_LYMST